MPRQSYTLHKNEYHTDGPPSLPQSHIPLTREGIDMLKDLEEPQLPKFNNSQIQIEIFGRGREETIQEILTFQVCDMNEMLHQ